MKRGIRVTLWVVASLIIYQFDFLLGVAVIQIPIAWHFLGMVIGEHRSSSEQEEE